MKNKFKKIIICVLALSMLFTASVTVETFADVVLTPTKDCEISFDNPVEALVSVSKSSTHGSNSKVNPLIGETSWLNLKNVESLEFTFKLNANYQNCGNSEGSASAIAKLTIDMLNKNEEVAWSKVLTKNGRGQNWDTSLGFKPNITATTTVWEGTYTLNIEDDLQSLGYDLSQVKFRVTPYAAASCASSWIAGASANMNQEILCTAKEQYTLTYSANGGSNPPSSVTVIPGTSVTISSTKPTRDKYKFVEWNTAQNGSGTAYAPGDSLTITKNTTLYAQWVLQIPYFSGFQAPSDLTVIITYS